VRGACGDVFGLLSKASYSSSSNSSASPKASIGRHAIDGSFFFEPDNRDHAAMVKEMQRNSLVFDKTKFAFFTLSMFERVISLFYLSEETGDFVTVKGICASRDSTQQV
jgi:hypothetical protein